MYLEKRIIAIGVLCCLSSLSYLGSVEAVSLGDQPNTTPPPSNGRIASSRILGYITTDNVCGFANAPNDIRWHGVGMRCDKSSSCIAVAASPKPFFGCCSGTKCRPFVTSCVNSHDYYTRSVCDGSCQSDPGVEKCLALSNNFCAAWTYPEFSITAYGCTFENLTTPSLTAYTSTPGDSNPQPWTTVYDTPGATSLIPGSILLGVSLPPTTSSKEAVSSTPANNVTSQASSESVLPSASNGGSGSVKKTSTPVGAIVGGVIGGVAVLAGAAIGFMFIIMRERRLRRHELGEPPVLPPAQEDFKKAELPGEDARRAELAGDLRGHVTEPAELGDR